MKLIYALLILLSTSFILCDSNDVNESEISKEKALDFLTYCHNRLIDKHKMLPPDEFYEFCELIEKYPLFMIRIRKENEYTIQGAVFLEASSFKYFEDKCTEFDGMCNYGFLIDIYIDDKIIIIQPGIKAKVLVNEAYRKRTLASVRIELAEGKWIKALHKILIWIIYKERGGKTKFFIPFSKEPKNFFYFILIPILSVGFISLSLFLYFMSKGYMNRDVFEFLDNIIYYWEKIKTIENQKIMEENEIKTQNVEREKVEIKLDRHMCIFCWNKTDNKQQEFSYCLHGYHEKCLRKWRLYSYGCCPCSLDVTEDNKKLIEKQDRPYLSLEDLKILLGLCLDAFRKEHLYDYFVEREEKIKKFNTENDQSLEELCWLYQNKVQTYKDYRLLYKMFKVWKMSIFILAFYPGFLKSKKVKLLSKLLQVKQRGATIEKL